MAKRLLIVGAGPGAVHVVEKARDLGLDIIALDSALQPVTHQSERLDAVRAITSAEVVQVARDRGVDGVYPATRGVLEAAAHAAAELDMPGLSPRAASVIHDVVKLRRTLQERGVATPRSCAAANLDEAHAAVRVLGVPLAISPTEDHMDDRAGPTTRMCVDYHEDVPLVFKKALRRSASKTALLEEKVSGERLWIEGWVYAGQFTPVGLAGQVVTETHRAADGILCAPAPAEDAGAAALETAQAALRAVGFTHGMVRIEIVVTPKGPVVLDVAAWPASRPSATDLFRYAGGCDVLGQSLRLAVGETPSPTRCLDRGAALAWLSAPAGLVAAVEGIREAAALPEVKELAVTAKTGDILRHDLHVGMCCVGYIIAHGRNAQEAVRAAQQARRHCRIIVRQVMPETEE